MTQLPIFKMLTFGVLPSFLKIWYYRFRGARIENNVKIGFFSIIDSKEIIIKEGARIGFLSYIKSEKLFLGKYSEINSLVYIDTRIVEIGMETIIMEQTVIGGMQTHLSKFQIGERCKVFPNCFLNTTFPIIIGDEVGIGGANYLFTHGSWQSSLDGFPIQFGPITIEDKVWLPWRVFIMPNVRLGRECTIGAGAIITKDIPSRSLAVGIPAKVIKNDHEYIKRLNQSDRVNIIKNIINDFIEYYKTLNWNFAVEVENELYMQISFVENNKNTNNNMLIVFENNISEDTINASDYLISMTEIHDDVKNKILKRNGSCYDLHTHKWYGKRLYVNLEIKNFLGRYGIRFKHAD